VPDLISSAAVSLCVLIATALISLRNFSWLLFVVELPDCGKPGDSFWTCLKSGSACYFVPTGLPVFLTICSSAIMTGEIARQWFVSGEGIDRHVIVADIQRYLGNDATVRPGLGTGDNEVRGYSPTYYICDTYCLAGCSWILDQSIPQSYHCKHLTLRNMAKQNTNVTYRP
jgi:hypothetical protein